MEGRNRSIMGVSVCVGNYAKIPYYVAGLDIPVYCMEELCYCIKENAFLLDVSLMEDELVKWVERECDIKELAKELHTMVHRQGALSSFVVLIMEYVGLYEEPVIREVEQVLKQGAGLSRLEKRKNQVDYLVKNKKYALALEGYDTLFEQCQETQGPSRVKADILHNKGVALTGMMLYGQAAEVFLSAYGLDHNPEDYDAYLAAKRLELSEEEYIAFVAEQPENYEASLQLEKKLEKLQADWQNQPACIRLKERGQLRSGNKQKYYDENERLTQALKDSYRHSAT